MDLGDICFYGDKQDRLGLEGLLECELAWNACFSGISLRRRDVYF